MEVLRIVLLSTVAAILYGILHDQVTVRICLEYFTVGHPKIIQSQSPTELGLAWGVVATWRLGAGLGLLLAVASRAGSRPGLRARDLLRSLTYLLGGMAAASLAAGLMGHGLASSGSIQLMEPWHSYVPRAAHVGFLTDLWAHSAAYGAALVGAIVLCVRIVRWRGRLARGIGGQSWEERAS